MKYDINTVGIAYDRCAASGDTVCLKLLGNVLAVAICNGIAVLDTETLNDAEATAILRYLNEVGANA